MAKNTGKGYREGEVRDHSQASNPKAKTWTKHGSETGQLMVGKEDGNPFKGGPEGEVVPTPGLSLTDFDSGGGIAYPKTSSTGENLG